MVLPALATIDLADGPASPSYNEYKPDSQEQGVILLSFEGPSQVAIPHLLFAEGNAGSFQMESTIKSSILPFPDANPDSRGP